jgi:hypothetical protein
MIVPFLPSKVRSEKRGQSDHRTVRQQHLAKLLHACGPRPVLEAMRKVEAGCTVDEALSDLTSLSAAVYHAVGANDFPDVARTLMILHGGRS